MAIMPPSKQRNPINAPQRRSQPCPACGGNMTFGTRPDTLEYKGHQTTVYTTGWWCGSCGEGILDGGALETSERALVALKAEVDAS